MNGKKAKKLRVRGRELLVEWLHSIVPPENANEINIDNVKTYLSEQTHVYLNRNFLLSAYSLKWIYKRVKRNPNLTLQQLNKDLEQL
tara:strand:+ start:628 stop:888 length:261 start_codon:yes stop_codon:yes gene_type:complete